MALNYQMLQQILQQRQAGFQPSQIQPGNDLLGGIQQPMNFADVLGGQQPMGLPGAMGAPIEGVMPQLQMQGPVASPTGQPTTFSPAGLLIGDLFARANQNSGPATPMEERQAMARRNVFPMKQQAGALAGAPMGIEGLR